MRYEDWDILIFPQDSKIPLQEFKTQCHVVHDPEFAFTSGSYGLPTLTCFVPGLTGGTPFNISLHNWQKPQISQYTRGYSQHLDIVKWEARVIIDGRVAASSSFSQDTIWPQLLSRSFEFTKNGELEPLKFPHFREELLQQNYWSPSDEVGRIKVVISEGFPRDSLTFPVERVKNLVTFSFQHAPMDILESSGIAWPNPRMWHRSPQVPTQRSEAHIHSPGRSSHEAGIAGWDWTFAGLGMTAPFPMSSRQAVQNTSRYARKYTSSDASMPDYISNPEPQQTGSHAHNNIFNGDPENGSHHPKAPSNTPNPLPNDIYISSANITRFPPDLATSLTQSLLNQPYPLPAQAGTTMTTSANEVKSRKEHRLGATRSNHNTPSLLDHLDMRKVSQGAFGDPSDNFGQTQLYENKENNSREASSGVSPQPSSRTFSGAFSQLSGSGSDITKKLNSTNDFTHANLEASTPIRMGVIGDVDRTGSGKRARHFTPTGPNADQDELDSTPHVKVGFGEALTN